MRLQIVSSEFQLGDLRFDWERVQLFPEFWLSFVIEGRSRFRLNPSVGSEEILKALLGLPEGALCAMCSVGTLRCEKLRAGFEGSCEQNL
jgi:hypothetical protein